MPITERTLVPIGDDCTLNAGSNLQPHSLEDGIFKSDHITVGNSCTIGVGAFVHYGATMGDRAVARRRLLPHEGHPGAAGARWTGNPAREVSVAAQSRVRMRI